MFFKKKDFIERGLFDEVFFIFFSDDDLCRKIKKRGKYIIQVFGYLGENFDPRKDLTLLQTSPLDTLDFTSGKLNVGSKVGFNCIGSGKPLHPDVFLEIKTNDPRNKIHLSQILGQ